uniref:Uncharacterized protein n=1 Tax=Glossina pallidipes TaxID=7398 RepID=A0A1B0ACT7_GLOPL
MEQTADVTKRGPETKIIDDAYSSSGDWSAPLLIEFLRNCYLISVNNTVSRRCTNPGEFLRGLSLISALLNARLPLPSSVLVANNGDCVDGVVVLSYVGCDRGDVNRD